MNNTQSQLSFKKGTILYAVDSWNHTRNGKRRDTDVIDTYSFYKIQIYEDNNHIVYQRNNGGICHLSHPYVYGESIFALIKWDDRQPSFFCRNKKDIHILAAIIQSHDPFARKQFKVISKKYYDDQYIPKIKACS